MSYYSQQLRNKASLSGCAVILVLLLYAFILGSWGTNLYRFVKCDFEPSYKAEIIHGIGLFTPTFLVTAWIPIEDSKPTQK